MMINVLNSRYTQLKLDVNMSDPISIFFEAWQIEDAKKRLEKITQSSAEDIQYKDPRTPNTLVGIDALSEYVGMFSANAPGWSANVVKSDSIGEMTRTTVAFSGLGPDGSKTVQHGQYFIEKHNDLISRMYGFVGTGEPD